jgi:hypothetical protein
VDVDVAPFLVAVEQPLLAPAPAVRRGLVAELADRLLDCGVPLEGDGGREERHVHAELLEQAQQAPDPCAAAVFVDGLDAQVAVLRRREVRQLADSLVAAVARGDRVLRASS